MENRRKEVVIWDMSKNWEELKEDKRKYRANKNEEEKDEVLRKHIERLRKSRADKCEISRHESS